MDGLSFLIKYVEVDPIERCAVAGAPHNIRHLNRPSIFHHRPAVTGGDGPGKAYHSGTFEVFELDAA
jgi:hypothetical protein